MQLADPLGVELAPDEVGFVEIVLYGPQAYWPGIFGAFIGHRKLYAQV